MPRELSGGERQRVALGRAIVRRPAAFLLDEPLSSLDPQLRVGMRRELKRLHRQLGATMVYVTHDQAEALALGDRLAVMHQGRLQQVGTPREVYEQPANLHVARFVGEPAMNMVPGALRDGNNGLSFCGGGLSVPLPADWLAGNFGHAGAPGSSQVIAGIRPEHLWVAVDGQSTLVGLGASPLATGQNAVPAEMDGHGWSSCGQGQVEEVEQLGAIAVAMVEVARPADPKLDAAENGAGGRQAEPEDRTGTQENSTEEGWEEHRIMCGPASGTRLAVLLAAAHGVQAGTHVALYVHPHRLHLFDAQSGQNLKPVTWSVQ